MKIKCNRPQHQKGSVLLMFIVAAVVVTGAGYVAYKLVEWTKNIDKQQKQPDQPENETSVTIPTTSKPSNSSIEDTYAVVELHRWWIAPWPDYTDMSIQEQSSNSQSKEKSTKILRIILNNKGETTLLITNNINWLTTSLTNLGIILDIEDGLPVTWTTTDQQPSTTTTLQKSSNLVDWSDVIELNLMTNIPAYFEINGNNPCFYRTKNL